MLKIQGTRNYLYQWDLNQKVIVVDNDSVNEVHFVNEGQNDNALIVEVKEDSKARYAEIPNILLQSGDNILAYEHCEDNGEYTFRKYLLEVIRRPKPADYIYTETEIKSYEVLQADLDKKIDAPQTAAVGEVLTVEEVGEDSKPKKWKTAAVNPKSIKDMYYEEQGAVTLFESYNTSDIISKVTLQAGKKYLVTVNGETYEATAVAATNYVMSGFSGGVILGDTIAPAKSPVISGNGFGIIQCYTNSGAMIVSSAAPYKIEEIGTVIHPVPSRYLGILQPLQSVSFGHGTEVKLSLEPYIEYRRIIGRATLVPETSYTGSMIIMSSVERMSVKSIINKFRTVTFTADRIGEDNSWIVRAWRECYSVNTTDTGDMFVTIHSGYGAQYFIAKGSFLMGAWELWGQP